MWLVSHRTTFTKSCHIAENGLPRWGQCRVEASSKMSLRLYDRIRSEEQFHDECALLQIPSFHGRKEMALEKFKLRLIFVSRLDCQNSFEGKHVLKSFWRLSRVCFVKSTEKSFFSNYQFCISSIFFRKKSKVRKKTFVFNAFIYGRSNNFHSILKK